MPVKKRIGKARRDLDREEMEDHFYGPGAALLNGCGYCGQITGKDRVEQLDTAEMAAVAAVMRADWERFRGVILEAWHARTAWDRRCAREFHGDPPEPWSATNFPAAGASNERGHP